MARVMLMKVHLNTNKQNLREARALHRSQAARLSNMTRYLRAANLVVTWTNLEHGKDECNEMLQGVWKNEVMPVVKEEIAKNKLLEEAGAALDAKAQE